jgi:hypothetical protein
MANSKQQKRSTQKPAQTFRSGSVQVAVWQNIGENGPFYSALLTRSFRDTAGKWRTSTTFGEQQLADLMTVAMAARQWMADHPLLQTNDNWNRRLRLTRGRRKGTELWPPIEAS